MPFLKVGRNHIDTDKIANVISPSKQNNDEHAVTIRYVWGAEEAFHNDDAEAIRAWLAKQLETVPPTGPVVQTKAPTPKR